MVNGAKMIVLEIDGIPWEEIQADAEKYQAMRHEEKPERPTTPSVSNIVGMNVTAGALRALLQPVLFLKLTENIGDFEIGDVVAAQFWGEGRVMLTPLPRAAARGRIPTTFTANSIHAEIDGPVPAS